MKRTLRMGVGSALVAGLLAGCAPEPEILSGVILGESFYPAGNLGGLPDRYTALVRLSSGEEIPSEIFNKEARIADLRYNVGDSVKIEKKGSKYKIVDDS